MATSPAHAPDLIESLNELTRVQDLQADWVRRGSPEPEGAVVRARLAAATAVFQAANDAVKSSRQELERRSPTAAAHAEAVKKAPPRARHRPPQQHANKDVINRETDARFWAQTGYRPKAKLDPEHNATDRSMAKVWLDIFHKVEAEDAAGHLVTTYDHPEVAQHLADAAVAQRAAELQLDAATKTADPWEQTQITQAAATANAMSQDSAKKAASYQPPTVSPAVVETASRDAHQAAKRPPPGVIIYPKGHPAHWHPSAQPAHPEFATPNAPEPEMPAAPLQTAADHLALANAANAPKNAADVHAADAGADGGDQIEPPRPQGGKRPGDKKTGLGLGAKVAIAAGGVVLVGGIGYAIYQSRRGSSSRTPAYLPPPLPRAR